VSAQIREFQRKTICRDCPFAAGKPSGDVSAAKEPGDPVVMLCHESGSLDGTGPDMVCKGFTDAQSYGNKT